MNFIRKIIVFVLLLATLLMAFSMSAFAAEAEDPVEISSDFDINEVQYTHYIHSGCADSRTFEFWHDLVIKNLGNEDECFEVAAAFSTGHYGVFEVVASGGMIWFLQNASYGYDTIVRVDCETGKLSSSVKEVYSELDSIGICFYTDSTLSEVGMTSTLPNVDDWTWGGLFSGFPTPPPKTLNSVTRWFSYVGDGLFSFTSSIIGTFAGGVESLVYDETGNYTVAFGFIVLGLIIGAGFVIFKIVRRKKL